MKHILFVLVAFLGLNTWAAQKTVTTTSSTSTQAILPPLNVDVTDGPIHLAPMIGVAAMGLSSPNFGIGTDTGLSMGGLVDFGNHYLTLETGAVFNQFGAKTDSLQINLSYISIPIVAKWNVLASQEKTVYLKGGVMPSILTSSGAKSGGTTISSSDLGTKSLDFGLLFGVGGTIPVASNASIVLDVSYLRGLSSVSDKNGFDTFRNEGFIFSSGVSLAL